MDHGYCSLDPMPNPQATDRLLLRAAQSIRKSEATLDRARSAADDMQVTIRTTRVVLLEARRRLAAYAVALNAASLAHSGVPPEATRQMDRQHPDPA